MFKILKKISPIIMSATNAKNKQTLAKKLSSKMAISVPPKGEAQEKPELFADIKNSQNSVEVKDNKEKAVSYPRKPKKKSIDEKEAKQTDDVVEPKKPRRTLKTNKIKAEPQPKEKSAVEIEIKSQNALREEKTSVKTEKKISPKTKQQKAKDNDLPSCSKVNKQIEDLPQKWEPSHWHQMLDNIRIMRSKDKAPVDTMGCHKCADEMADEKTKRFHKLVALMLSSQTKDETTYHAMLRLREHILTPESICEMKVNVLENVLHPVSFYKNKAKYLQQTSKILMEKYNSDIPNNIKELVALPGVGPKMAHICMSTAWNETTGIGVDVHVHRICNRLQWMPKTTKEPEQTRIAIESWLPQNLWKEVNHLLVGFGQTICTPLKPKCSECLNCAICPAAPKSQEKVQNIAIKNICDQAKFKKSKMHL